MSHEHVLMWVAAAFELHSSDVRRDVRELGTRSLADMLAVTCVRYRWTTDTARWYVLHLFDALSAYSF